MENSSGKNYITMIVYLFVAFGSFVVAILSAYFGGVGLFFGQSVVEGDVFTGGYKYDCNDPSQSASQCTNLSTTETSSYTALTAYTTNLNSKLTSFLTATLIVFSLLGLVFLFLAIKESGMMNKKKENDDNMRG